jgi:peptide/nickel transport system substrate-binding protein
MLGSFCVVVSAAALLLAGCQSNSASRLSRSNVQLYRGGTVVWAKTGLPTWIFPFIAGNYYSVGNTLHFQSLMYRPLYWFGQIESPSSTFNEQLSLAHAPTLSNGGRTVVIRLKGWKFSNGQGVDAQSVVFWMNMLMAEGRFANATLDMWGASTPGEFPYNVASYSAPDGPRGDLVTISFDERYSSTWLLYNELSQITPMPEAWDITSLDGTPGSGRCGVVSTGEMNGSATAAACTRVWTFDTDDDETSLSPHMSGDLDTYGSNPLWQVVDGPWRLSSYDVSGGQITFVPNPRYSGPQRPILSKFVERFYPSDAAILAALERGGQGAPDLAGISPDDLPVNNGPPGSAGANRPQLARRFNLDLSYPFEITYASENYNSTSGDGAPKVLFSQLYIRQALQLLVNQSELIGTAGRGYGVPVHGPVPLFPKTQFLSKYETANPYPYDPSKAVRLLRDHGWIIHPEGADVCGRPGTAPGDCGKGIQRYTKLSLSFLYPNNNGAWYIQLVVAESSAWAQAGIQVALQGEQYSSLLAGATGPCDPKSVGSCDWEIATAAGWVYEPDYLPTGEYLFSNRASINAGSYSDTTANHLIAKTLTSSDLGDMFDYENYLAQQLPVIWQPTNDVTTVEVSKGLGGASSFSSYSALTPEYWYWKTPSRS